MTIFELLGVLRFLYPLLEKVRPPLVKTYFRLFPATKRAHFNELRTRLRQMPFIYRPLGDKHFGEDLEKDYVQIWMRPLELSTLQFNSGTNYDPTSKLGDEDMRILDLSATYEMVRSNRTCIIFGHAGVGKTTFASYCVLSLINRLIVEGFYPFDISEQLIPFLVPLKVVDESESNPILSYLLRSNRYLYSSGGLKRLIRLCQRGKVLLVLDGYDEVYSATNMESALRAEIDAIFNHSIPITKPGPPTKRTADFYYYLAKGKNRVWLTTRKDFYRQNRLLVESKSQLQKRVQRWIAARYGWFKWIGQWSYDSLTEVGYYGIGDPGIASIEILGVWERAELTRKIFDRYKNLENHSHLDVQEFLSFVDSHYDDETRKLSLNPLFLTVMCYVYIQHTFSATQSEGSTLRDLVSECVRLLIQELDEERVRLPIPYTGKALKDRLAFHHEKQEFLQYFASRCFHDERLLRQKVFTEQDLVAALTQYTRLATTSSLREVHKKPVEIIQQLIYQGVFVVADASVERTFYDFPHRRFREILAVKYWDNEETFAECLAMVGEPHFAEFVLVFFKTSTSFQNALLQQILNGIDGSSRGEHLGHLASACLENAPDSYSPQKTISRWVERVANERSLRELPTGIVDHFVPDQELLARLFFQLGESKTRGDIDSVRFHATLLAQIAPQTVQRLFTELMSERQDVSQTVCEVILKQRREFVPSLLAQLKTSEFLLLSGLALSTIPAAEKRWWLLVLRSLSGERLVLFQHEVEKAAPDIKSCIKGLQQRECTVKAIIGYLTRELPGFTFNRKSDSHEPEELFTIAGNGFLPDRLTGVESSLTSDLVFEQDFLYTKPMNIEDLCVRMNLAKQIRSNPEKKVVVSQTSNRVVQIHDAF
jgi:hypothetical protein